jgi:uncharacterized membrane protein YfcA
MNYGISLVGLLVGFLVGMTGMGGGSLLAPILILILRVPPVWAVGTDNAYSAVTKAFGSVVHIQQKTFSLKNLKIALRLACGSVPATLLGVGVVEYMHKHYGDLIDGVILRAIGFTLILVAIVLIVKPFIMRRLDRKRTATEKELAQRGEIVPDEEQSRWAKRYRPLITVLIGAFVGFLVGLTSVGSGTLIIVALAFLYPRLATKELVGADIVHAVALNLAGAIAYFIGGTINWPIVGMLLIGSLPGVFLGSKLSKLIPDRFMRPILATVLVLSGWKLM